VGFGLAFPYHDPVGQTGIHFNDCSFLTAGTGIHLVGESGVVQSDITFDGCFFEWNQTHISIDKGSPAQGVKIDNCTFANSLYIAVDVGAGQGGCEITRSTFYQSSCPAALPPFRSVAAHPVPHIRFREGATNPPRNWSVANNQFIAFPILQQVYPTPSPPKDWAFLLDPGAIEIGRIDPIPRALGVAWATQVSEITANTFMGPTLPAQPGLFVRACSAGVDADAFGQIVSGNVLLGPFPPMGPQPPNPLTFEAIPFLYGGSGCETGEQV
jgi:hypothetical protein